MRGVAGCPGSPQEGPALLRVALALREAKQRGRSLWTHQDNHGADVGSVGSVGSVFEQGGGGIRINTPRTFTQHITKK